MSAFDKGTVIISVDDGRVDAYRFFKEILEPYNIPATFNIVTDWVKAGGEKLDWVISREELTEIASSPLVEIAGHGHTHKNSDEDILTGRQKLCEWLGLSGKIGFASPGSGMKGDFVRENAKKLSDMGFLYIRSCDGAEGVVERHSQLIAQAKANGYSDYVIENIPRMAYEYDGIFVNSAVVTFNSSEEDIKRLTEIAINEKACILFMFHSFKKIGEPAYDDTYSYDFDKAKQLAEYWSMLKSQGKLDIMTNKAAFIKGYTAKDNMNSL